MNETEWISIKQNINFREIALKAWDQVLVLIQVLVLVMVPALVQVIIQVIVLLVHCSIVYENGKKYKQPHTVSQIRKKTAFSL